MLEKGEGKDEEGEEGRVGKIIFYLVFEVDIIMFILG